MFKKSLLTFLVVIMTVLLVGCVDTSNTNSDSSNNATAQIETQKEVVILDNEIITAIYRGVVDMPDIGYFYVKLNIENKLEKEIWVTLESADVDGETIPLITTGMPVHIRSGNSYLASYGFPTMNLSINSAKDAKEATFKIVVRDKENIMDTIFESDLITVNLTQ